MITLYNLEDGDHSDVFENKSDDERTIVRRRRTRSKSLSLPDKQSLCDIDEESLPMHLRPRPKCDKGFSRARLCSVCWKEESDRAMQKVNGKFPGNSDEQSVNDDFDDSKDIANSDVVCRINLRRSEKGELEHSSSGQKLIKQSSDNSVLERDKGHTLNSRHGQRRGALCDPERMLLPQYKRESVQNDISDRRKSLKRKISNFFTVKLNLDKEEDLF